MVQGRIFHRDTLLLPSLLLILNGGSPFAGIVAMVKKLMSGTILWADVSSSISNFVDSIANEPSIILRKIVPGAQHWSTTKWH